MASNLPVEVAGVGTFDNVEALLSAIEEGRIEQDPEFIKDIEEAVCCIDEKTYFSGVPCEFCSFVAKTNGGLSSKSCKGKTS